MGHSQDPGDWSSRPEQSQDYMLENLSKRMYASDVRETSEALVGLKWAPFTQFWSLAKIWRRVESERVLVAVTPSALCRCEDLTKKPGRSNEVCHKRFTIIPLNPASSPLLWKHTFRPLNLLRRHRIQHKGGNYPHFRLVPTEKTAILS